LKKVGQKALEDRQFFDALVTAPETALEQADMSLSAPDLQTLKRAFRRGAAGRFSLVEFLDRFHTDPASMFGHWDVPWLAQWVRPTGPPPRRPPQPGPEPGSRRPRRRRRPR
jgi:hypothetical protein